ncbi:MAG: hypothetical protein ABI999_11505 [Acidobacteriota bacterium]
MPRYRYIKAEFNIPAIDRIWVEVPRIEIGIKILEAVGDGRLTLTGRSVKTPRFRIAPSGRLPINHLSGHGKDKILRLFDRECDIACARQECCTVMHTLHFPDELLKRFRTDAQHRLRHFAALVVSGIKIGSWNIWSPIEHAALDAGLNMEERQVGYQYEKEKRLAELLADPYPWDENGKPI